MRRPSGLKLTANGNAPFNVRSSSPVSASHNLIVPNELADARRRPSRAKAYALNWTSVVQRHEVFPRADVPQFEPFSKHAAARRRPSGLKTTLLTGPWCFQLL